LRHAEFEDGEYEKPRGDAGCIQTRYKGFELPPAHPENQVILNKMQPGEILFVESTDPHSVVDFEAYCARTLHELISINQSGEVYEFYIRRAEHPHNI
jgi:Predicted redox protein, regulator of disulfide bond formation